jgi:hypothetical protein
MTTVEAPPKSRIIKATVVALAIAAVVLVTVILPAEYGLDPLGTGAMLGLTDLAESREATTGAVAAAPVTAATANHSQPSVYQVDSREITLKPGGGVELKYHMPKDGALVYSWTSTGLVQFEFHGEPDVKPNPDYYDSYEINDTDGRMEGHGSFIAPSTGIHGWYWKNITDKDVTVTLNAAGFINFIKFFSPDGVREYPAADAAPVTEN